MEAQQQLVVDDASLVEFQPEGLLQELQRLGVAYLRNAPHRKVIPDD